MIYWTFIQSPYFWYLISGRQKTPFLVFNVSGATGTQIIKGKLHSWFFVERKAEGRRPKRGEPRGPKGVGPRGPSTWPRGTHQVGPRAPPRLGLFIDAFVLPEKSRPNFPETIRGRGGGETPDSLRGGSDPAAPELRRRGKSSSSSSPLLLGVGGGLYIITITKTSTISIIISVIHSVPLVVWELLYPRYLSCATIHVWDWVLVIIWWWSYIFRLCCTTYATEYYHVCTSWVVPICSWGHRMNWQWFIYNMCWYFVKSLSFMWFYDGVVRTSTAQHFTYMGS